MSHHSRLGYLLWLCLAMAVAAPAVAYADGDCPAGYHQVGQQDEHEGATTITHAVCEEDDAPALLREPEAGGPILQPERQFEHVERGLVGGTTWTFGQNRHCNPACKAQLDKTFLEDLALYCAGQPDPAECQKHAPFTPELYDFVVSFGSSHTAIDDLATRVLWDGTTYGEYTRANKELFASLIGKSFDTLDCHSNGAMACLAALRNGDTKAREVRLFGPQINKEAAQRWLEVARASDIKLVIYIRTGDPVPGLAWGIDTDARANASVVLGRVGQLATGDPEEGSTWGALPGVISAWQESRSGTVSQELANLGLEVHRLPCATAGALDIACHAMTGYEHSREGLDSVPAVPVRR